MFKSSASVIAEAKKAFKDSERTHYEKYKHGRRKRKPVIKKVGFVDGMRSIVVWR